MSELKPCPFCGAYVSITHAHGCKYVLCANCQTQSQCYYDTYDNGLIRASWNSRPIEDALRKRVEELEDFFHEAILCATIHANGKLRERIVQIANEALKEEKKGGGE